MTLTTYTSDDLEAAVANVAAGNALRTTAQEFGIPYTTLHRHVNKAGPGAPGSQPADSYDGLTVDPGDELNIPVIIREYDEPHHFVYPLGDIHKGAAMHLSESWRRWTSYLAETPQTSMLGTGDFLNSALKDSVSDVYDEKQTVQEAKWELADELSPLAERDGIDLLTPGNHEGRIIKAIGDDPIYDVARSLNAPYARVAALVVYRIGDVEYEVYVRHGRGSGRAGAQATRMERDSQTIVADVYVQGHTHRQQVLRGAILQRQGEKIVRRRQVYVTSGSFLGSEAYAVTAGLPPADVGAPRIRLDGRTHDVHVSI